MAQLSVLFFSGSILTTTNTGHILDCSYKKIKSKIWSKAQFFYYNHNKNNSRKLMLCCISCFEGGVVVRWCMPLVMSLRLSRQKRLETHEVVSWCCCLKALSVRNKVGTLSSVCYYIISVLCRFIIIPYFSQPYISAETPDAHYPKHFPSSSMRTSSGFKIHIYRYIFTSSSPKDFIF